MLWVGGLGSWGRGEGWGGGTYSPAMTLGALPQRRRYWLLRGVRFDGGFEEGRASVVRGRRASSESVAVDGEENMERE